MTKKIIRLGIIVCSILWIIAIPYWNYDIELFIKDTIILVQYSIIPIVLSVLIGAVVAFDLIRKYFSNN